MRKIKSILSGMGVTLLMFGCAGFDSNWINASICMIIGCLMIAPAIKGETNEM